MRNHAVTSHFACDTMYVSIPIMDYLVFLRRYEHYKNARLPPALRERLAAKQKHGKAEEKTEVQVILACVLTHPPSTRTHTDYFNYSGPGLGSCAWNAKSSELQITD